MNSEILLSGFSRPVNHKVESTVGNLVQWVLESRIAVVFLVLFFFSLSFSFPLERDAGSRVLMPGYGEKEGRDCEGPALLCFVHRWHTELWPFKDLQCVKYCARARSWEA